MKKNILLTIKLAIFSLIFNWLFVNFNIDRYIHNRYYDIHYKSDCAKYEKLTSQEIILNFKDVSNYTKWQAAYFFHQCKNKNATPFIYLNLNYTKDKNYSPLDIFKLGVNKFAFTNDEYIYAMIKDILSNEKNIYNKEIQEFSEKNKQQKNKSFEELKQNIKKVTNYDL